MLTVISGPMYSGKSSALLSLVDANRVAGNSTALFKPQTDNRYSSNEIVTHRGARVLCHTLPIFDLEMVYEFIKIDTRVFMFDEAQFFVPTKLIKVVEDLLYNYRVEVVISGLSQDSEGRPFGAMPHLLAIADDIIHLKAVCSVTKQIGTATRTYRKDSSTNQVAVGGTEMYEARSFNEWLK